MRIPLRGPLANSAYRRMLGAQVIALVGTGLTTVALTLLAYDLANRNAGAVVGVALALKMVVYVFGAPLITAVAARLPRRRLLVTLDLLRAGGVAATSSAAPPPTSPGRSAPRGPARWSPPSPCPPSCTVSASGA